MKSGNLNFLEPCGPLEACNGTALLLPIYIYIYIYIYLYVYKYICQKLKFLTLSPLWFVPQYTLSSACFYIGHKKRAGRVFENTVVALKLQNCEMLTENTVRCKTHIEKGLFFWQTLAIRRDCRKTDAEIWLVGVCCTCGGRFTELAGHYIRFEALDKYTDRLLRLSNSTPRCPPLPKKGFIKASVR